MSKYQYPIDGAMGKTWKITSKMGWRVHPVKKERSTTMEQTSVGLARDLGISKHSLTARF